MDAILPFIQRTPGTPVEQEPKVVVPVFKEARLSPLKQQEQKFLILRRSKKRPGDNQDYPEPPYTTPEEDLHVDKDGHLDIFV
ncbi:hypothetical protein [Arsukibacterium sp.]|uniref:hypothetical protein n=1 Tax=Arsukibacterium sp. TaxID=1977258 RepID=UPI002FDA015E